MGPQLYLPDSQAGGLTEVYDRLASLLDRHDPGRLAAFWEGLLEMPDRRHRKPAKDSLAGTIAARISALGLTPYAVAS